MNYVTLLYMETNFMYFGLGKKIRPKYFFKRKKPRKIGPGLPQSAMLGKPLQEKQDNVN